MTHSDTKTVMDFGGGFTGYFIGWNPDRDIPSNAERYKNIPDLERAALLLTCPHGDGGVSVHPPEYDIVFGYTGWRVLSWEPLTLSPSILRTECGCHGYIREGKWVQA